MNREMYAEEEKEKDLPPMPLDYARVLLEHGADMNYCHVEHSCHSCTMLFQFLFVMQFS
jgi:hypothetical protein